MTRAAVRDLVAREVLPSVGDPVAKGDRGILSIFWGSSGMGRTMAAKVLASKLRFQLLQVNLGHGANKYIGETEKNLRRVFHAASEAPAVLVFDEADALFGKRTDVKDARDRYANLQASFLLELVEHVRGVLVLSANESDHIDEAFVKRARCIVCFKDD